MIRRMMRGTPFRRQKKIIVRFLELERKSLALRTKRLKGLVSGRKIRAPRQFIVRCTSHTPMAEGFPVAKAATITSKTVPMLAPRM